MDNKDFLDGTFDPFIGHKIIEINDFILDNEKVTKLKYISDRLYDKYINFI